MTSIISSGKYTELQILALVKALESDEDAFKWLVKNCLELAALSDFLLFRKNNAREWLIKNNYLVLCNFINAVSDYDYYDDDSNEFLIKSNHREWAAVVSIVNDGDENADIWLIKSGLKHFALLGETISKLLLRRRNYNGLGLNVNPGPGESVLW